MYTRTSNLPNVRSAKDWSISCILVVSRPSADTVAKKGILGMSALNEINQQSAVCANCERSNRAFGTTYSVRHRVTNNRCRIKKERYEGLKL